MNGKIVAILVIIIYISTIIYQFILAIRAYKKGNRSLYKKIKKVFKYSIFIILIFGLSILVLNRVNFLDYESPLTFDKFNKITFENFRGFDFFRKSFNGSKYYAFVATTIDYELEDNFVRVQSLFHPSRSYVYNKKTSSKELLKHEKYHIKITELFVRKAKKEISKLSQFNKNKIESILTKTKQNELNYQRKYDFDTYHSYILEQQKKYEIEIDSLLNVLKDYQNPKIQFNDEN